MSYIRRINHFWDVQRMSENLGVNDIAVYTLLLDFANRQFWPEWVTMGTQKACMFLGISKQTFGDVRGRLIDAGLIEYKAGNRKSSPSYRIFCPNYAENSDLTPDLTPDPYKEEREKKESRAEEGAKRPAVPAAATLGEVVAEVEAEFPRRADVGEIAETLLDRYPERKMTVKRLKSAVKREREPKYKAAEKPKPKPAPEGWEGVFAEMFGSLPSLSWEMFAQRYPDDARKISDKLDGERGDELSA